MFYNFVKYILDKIVYKSLYLNMRTNFLFNFMNICEKKVKSKFNLIDNKLIMGLSLFTFHIILSLMVNQEFRRVEAHMIPKYM